MMNKTATAIFKCGAKINLPNIIGKVSCNRTYETGLFNDGQYTYFYAPDEWHIKLGYIVSEGANTIVRCPEHCAWTETGSMGGHWKDVPGIGTSNWESE